MTTAQGRGQPNGRHRWGTRQVAGLGRDWAKGGGGKEVFWPSRSVQRTGGGECDESRAARSRPQVCAAWICSGRQAGPGNALQAWRLVVQAGPRVRVGVSVDIVGQPCFMPLHVGHAASGCAVGCRCDERERACAFRLCTRSLAAPISPFALRAPLYNTPHPVSPSLRRPPATTIAAAPLTSESRQSTAGGDDAPFTAFAHFDSGPAFARL